MTRKIPRQDFGGIAVKLPFAQSGQRIGVMGGSFNPAHDGHRIVAETAKKRLRLDQVWWVVTPGNPLKETARLPSLTDRMAYIRTLTQDPAMIVTGFEDQLGTPYTAATLGFLKARSSGVRFVWLMGADNLASFDRWQHWRTIAATMPIAVVDRPGWRLKALSSRAAHALSHARISENLAADLADRPAPAWVFLSSRLSPLSSTALRAARAELATST